MSRTVDLILTLDLDVDLHTGRPVVGVDIAEWNSPDTPDELHELEDAVDVVLAELAPLLADVTGELEGGQG